MGNFEFKKVFDIEKLKLVRRKLKFVSANKRYRQSNTGKDQGIASSGRGSGGQRKI